MTLYYVSSINRLGATITTRHFSVLAVQAEKLMRLMDGHIGISVQEGPMVAPGESCVKRKPVKIRRPPHGSERRH